jgi:hypothetical protein
MKSTKNAYLLCIIPSLFGIAGIHRFYLGKIGTGLIYLFTFGLLGIGIIYDLFTIPRQVREANLLRGGINMQSNQNVIVNVNTGSESPTSKTIE